MGPKYFVRSKESWKQLVDRVHHYKTPQPSSQPNNDGTSSGSPKATQQSMGKRRGHLSLSLGSGGGEGDDEVGGGEDHRRLSKRTKRCKGE